MRDATQNILVIGGSGFLSKAIVRQALAGGHRVWALTRGWHPIPNGATALVADRRDEVAFQRAVTDARTHWDLVVDSIAFNAADLRQDISVFAPLSAHLVFVSTDFVYDPARRRFPQPEDAEAYLAIGYGGEKRNAELELIGADTGSMQWTIVRPTHIYGPGSQLGCLPQHGRDPELINHIRQGKPLKLVGGGHFLQQPVFAADLARTILSTHGNASAHGKVFNVAGPDIVESLEYYRIIAKILNVEIAVEEALVDAFLRERPEAAPFLCHRIYDLARLREASMHVPATRLEDGLRAHVDSLL